MDKTKKRIIYLIIAILFTFVLVYTPHFQYHLPIHIDEWHHITEAIKIGKGEIATGLGASKMGFHVILAGLNIFTNLIKIYPYLPAIWATLTALILFFIVRKKTKTSSSFFIAILSVIFFASIKSNVNITGLWFFTPISFSILFIYLYMYFFSEGILEQSKKMLLASLIIMILLVFIHPISVLFAIPTLLIFLAINYKKSLAQFKILLLFLIIPILGLFFFKFLLNLTFAELFKRLFTELLFKHGWGVLEMNNSFFELYSLVGYILAAIGIFAILSSKKLRKKYSIYVTWPIAILAMILIFRFTGISFLSPYQRNLYYFVISMPFLSAYGLFYIIKLARKKLKKSNLNEIKKEKIFETIKILLVILVIILSFVSYFSISKNVLLYKTVVEGDMESLEFLSTLPKSTVMAQIHVSTALFPLTGHQPVGTILFYGNREIVSQFFKTENCYVKDDIIKEYNVSYVYSSDEINCGWRIIYNKDNRTVYEP